MIVGPMPAGVDDPFADPEDFPNGNTNGNGGSDPADHANRAAVLAWQERQRRQRTLRLLMMFLMVLMLMDGEEPDRHNRRNRHNGSSSSMGGGSGTGKRNPRWEEYGGLPLEKDVFLSRAEEDRLVRAAAGRHPRAKQLVAKNGGRDVEGELRERSARGFDEEEAAAATSPGDSGGASATTKDRTKSASAAEDEAERKDGATLVYHYPRNATGYYRGHWVRVSRNNSLNDDYNMGTGIDPHTKSIGAGENDEEAKDDGESSSERIVTAREIEPYAQRRLERRGETAALLLLPPDTYFRPEGNATSSALGRATAEVGEPHSIFPPKADSGGSHPISDGEGPSSFLRRSSSAPPPPPMHADSLALPSFESTGRPATIGLTRDAGRVAFQLYSRPVPGMTGVGMVDGLVKLYNGQTSSFVAKRTDVLLRVRGVAIHGMGRMSLVAVRGKSEGQRRSALVLRTGVDEQDDKGEDGDGTTVDGGRKGDEGDKPPSSGVDRNGDEQIDERRRRLQETTDELLSRFASGGGEDESGGILADELTLMKRLRDDVLELHFASVARDYLSSSSFDGDQMDGGKWTLLRSANVEELFDDEALGIDKEDDSHRESRRLAELEKNGNAANSSAAARLATNVGAESDVAGNDNPANDNENLREVEEALPSLHRSTLASSTTIREENPARDVDTKEIAGSSTTSSSNVYPFPYVRDDAQQSIRKVSSPAARRLPTREQALEANAAECEFEMNIDVREMRWTVGEWQASVDHQTRVVRAFDPSWKGAQDSPSDGEGEGRSEESPPSAKVAQYLLAKTRIEFLGDGEIPREALVMSMVGTIESPNCDFNSVVNVTAIRTNWEHTTAKAINYSFYMMLICLTQIVVLLRQLLHTQAQSAASNVSLLCLGWQTVLDALLCIGHIFLCLVMQPLFTAFASVAFFKLLIFCVIEMKYMAIIIQARNGSNNTGTTQVDLRRQITLLHLRFYGALMTAIIAFWYLGQTNRTLYVLLLYSFWVPQIVLNVISESRKPMHPYYIYGMSSTRLIAPLYVFAAPNNFLKEVNPDFPTDFRMSELLVLWVGVQTAILIAQGKYGTRFMIPQRFLPPKFDYSRQIPPSLLPPTPAADNSSNGAASEIQLAPLLQDESPPRDRSTNGVTRNRRGGGARMRPTSSTVEESPGGGTSMSTENGDAPTLDCVICYNPIDVNDRRGYMLAPCDHIFHRPCLEQWMEVKMECPICRKDLPAL